MKAPAKCVFSDPCQPVLLALHLIFHVTVREGRVDRQRSMGVSSWSSDRQAGWRASHSGKDMGSFLNEFFGTGTTVPRNGDGVSGPAAQ